MPLAAFAGQGDDRAPLRRMEGWRRFAASPAHFSLNVFPGSHFFIKVRMSVCTCMRAAGGGGRLWLSLFFFCFI
jgi:surfactin synthase thioesterase subunit